MSDPITPEIFDHLVQLAALELSAEEAEYIRHQLNNQLKAIHELEAIPLDNAVAITSHGVPYTAETRPAPRPDEWIPYPDVDAILAQAPEVEDRYIVVPDIPHTTLE
jgi:aspartyl-tRNA(Asn)/glutamyl-tRNA(Gln) amidotransferase subunit C